MEEDGIYRKMADTDAFVDVEQVMFLGHISLFHYDFE